MQSPMLIILYFIESILMVFAGGLILGFSSRKPLLFATVAIINGLFVYLIRNAFLINKLPIGLHAPIVFVVFAILISVVLKTGWKVAFGTSLIGFIVLIASEIILLPRFVSLLNIDPTQIMSNPGQHLILGILDTIPLMIIILVAILKGRFNATSIGAILSKFS